MNRRSSVLFILLIVAIPLASFAGAAGPIGRMAGGGDAVHWQPSVNGYDHIVLSVVAPTGELRTLRFPAGRTPTLRLADLPGKAADGVYSFQLMLVPRIPEGVAKQLADARAAGDDVVAAEVMRANGLFEPVVQGGGIIVANGAIVPISEAPERPARPAQTNAAARPPLVPVTDDDVIADDLIVQGNTCIGVDCVNGEVFDDITLRLKENNLRIQFDDTSGASFPNNDWKLIANDSVAGFPSWFAIQDDTGNKNPFRIVAGAAESSIYVDSTGRVGLRTSSPVLDLHLNTNNSPGIRLEQNSSGGFTAQTWDIVGNEANFFIRDLTHSSQMPFRIRPGAPTNAIDITADGDIGINTSAPAAGLHVISTNANQTAVRVRSTVSTGNSGIELADSGGTVDLFFGIVNSTGQHRLNSLNDNPMVHMVNSVEKMRVDTTGVTITGNFTVTGTKSFAMPDPADAAKMIHYVSLEGPEAGTYIRGTAKTVNGEVTIELPGYFSRITESERMTVHLTPIGAPALLYVDSQSPKTLIIKAADGSPDVEFAYIVHGIRKGYLDYDVVR